LTNQSDGSARLSCPAFHKAAASDRGGVIQASGKYRSASEIVGDISKVAFINSDGV
jgi:hypothetical protein